MNAMKYRCAACGALKGREHFHKSGVSLHSRRHDMRCSACFVRCAGCGERRAIESVKAATDDGETKFCPKCRERRAVAKGNVYYRYPVLHYRAAPFSVEKYRSKLEEAGDTDDAYAVIRSRRVRPK
jgi:DNA-directed RNA polymerase subunit RPC12/RpoP